MAYRTTHTRRRGLGLAELLIALSISAAVLTAVAVAADAGFRSYQANAAAGDTAQRARLTLDRALTLLRSTDDDHDALGQPHYPGPANAEKRAIFAQGEVVTDSGFVAFEPYFKEDGSQAFRRVVWTFDAAAGEIRQQVDGGTARVVLRNVTEFRCTFQPMRSAATRRRGFTTHDQLRRATLVLTVGVAPFAGVGPNAAAAETFTLSGSASPRRNIGV